LLVAICLFSPFGLAQENIPAELLPVLQYVLKRSSTCRSLSVRAPTEKSISRLAYEIFIRAPVFRRASLRSTIIFPRFASAHGFAPRCPLPWTRPLTAPASVP